MSVSLKRCSFKLAFEIYLQIRKDLLSYLLFSFVKFCLICRLVADLMELPACIQSPTRSLHHYCKAGGQRAWHTWWELMSLPCTWCVVWKFPHFVYPFKHETSLLFISNMGQEHWKSILFCWSWSMTFTFWERACRTKGFSATVFVE